MLYFLAEDVSVRGRRRLMFILDQSLYFLLYGTQCGDKYL